MNSFMLLWTNTKHASRRPLKRSVTCAFLLHNYIRNQVHMVDSASLIQFIFIISGLFQMFGMSKVVAERSSALNEVESSLPLRTVSE